jgi:hypothetical protein
MGQRLHIVSGCREVLAAHGLDSVAGIFRFTGGERLDKPGLEPWRERLRLTLPAGDGPPRTFYLKRFSRPPLRRQVQRWLAGGLEISTAGCEWRNVCRLAEAGIPAAQAVAFGQEMRGPFERRSFILLGQVPGESLERWVPAHLSGAACAEHEDRPAGRRQDRGLRERLDDLARFVAAFHRAGFVHRDLYLSHVFISEAEPDSFSQGAGLPACSAQTGTRFRLIDLQRVFRPRWRHRRWVVKDLAALHDSTPVEYVSLRERLRFLCRYARMCDRFGRARDLAGWIERRSRRQRPLRPRKGPDTLAEDCSETQKGPQTRGPTRSRRPQSDIRHSPSSSLRGRIAT